VGHEGQFSSPKPNGRCRLSDATFAGIGNKEEDTPETVIRIYSDRLACEWKKCQVPREDQRSGTCQRAPVEIGPPPRHVRAAIAFCPRSVLKGSGTWVFTNPT
jgi:hypothetical protein